LPGIVARQDLARLVRRVTANDDLAASAFIRAPFFTIWTSFIIC
jgi:hypothetical protein